MQKGGGGKFEMSYSALCHQECTPGHTNLKIPQLTFGRVESGSC